MVHSFDLTAEFVNLFKQEDVVAYFDFTVAVPDGQPLSGICKIAKPGSGKKMNYLSLVFVCDILGSTPIKLLEQPIKSLNEENLKRFFPLVETAISEPTINTGPEVLVKQVDILLGERFQPDDQFIYEKLVPVIQTITGFQIGESVRWDTRDEGQTSEKAAPAAELVESSSFVEMLKKLIR